MRGEWGGGAKIDERRERRQRRDTRGEGVRERDGGGV